MMAPALACREPAARAGLMFGAGDSRSASWPASAASPPANVVLAE
jgi:hypothetical protein